MGQIHRSHKNNSRYGRDLSSDKTSNAASVQTLWCLQGDFIILKSTSEGLNSTLSNVSLYWPRISCFSHIKLTRHAFAKHFTFFFIHEVISISITSSISKARTLLGDRIIVPAGERSSAWTSLWHLYTTGCRGMAKEVSSFHFILKLCIVVAY